MAVLFLVVDRRAPLYDLLQGHRIENFILARRTPDFLCQRERGTAVAVGHADQRSARLGVERQCPALDFFGTGEKLFDRSGIKRLKYQHAGPGKQWSDQLKRRLILVVAPTSTIVPSSITGRKNLLRRLKR